MSLLSPAARVRRASSASDRGSVGAGRNVKCVVVGDGASGKTTLLFTYANKQFPGEYMPTVFDNHSQEVQIQGENKSFTVALGLWDTSGQADYVRIRPLSYSRTDLFLVCYSITSPSSFENVKTEWVPEVRRHCPETPIILVATKTDLREDQETIQRLSRSWQKPVTEEMGRRLAKEIGAAQFVECSALYQSDVEALFRQAAIVGAQLGVSASEPVVAEQFACGPAVDLAYRNLDDKGMRAVVGHLRKHSGLVSLNLSSNMFTVRGAAMLAKNILYSASVASLTELDIGNNNLGIDAAPVVALLIVKCPCLRSVDLRGNNLGPRGAKIVAKAISSSLSLDNFNMSGNAIGAVGARAVVQAVLESSSVTAFDVGTLDIDALDIQMELAAARESMPRVLCQASDAEGRVEGAVVIDGHRLDASAVARILGNAAKVTALHIRNCAFDIVLPGHLLGGLRTLSLTRTGGVTLDDGRGLGAMQSLQFACVVGSGLVDGLTGVELLLALASLKTVRNAASSVDDRVVAWGGRPDGDDSLSLDLSRCNLRELPIGLRGMSRLSDLNISGNKIFRLPTWFHTMTELEALNAAGNPWLTPPEAMMASVKGSNSADVKRVRKFMASLAEQGGRVCRTARLMLIGLGTAGKTSLLRAMMSDDDMSDPIDEDDRTVGIETIDWQPDDDQEHRGNSKEQHEAFTLRMYDFAGQQVYYSTHQFFLSSRVVYVLVFKVTDVRGMSQAVTQWLDVLQARVPGATVLTVATHVRAQGVTREVVAQKCAEVRSIIHGFLAAHQGEAVPSFVNDGVPFEADCLTGSGIAAVRSAVVAAGKALPHVGELVPKQWVALRDALAPRTVLKKLMRRLAKSRASPLVELRGIEKAAKAAKLSMDNAQSALDYWDTVGEVLYFHGLDAVVTRPSWIIDVLRSLVRHDLASAVEQSLTKSARKLLRTGIADRELWMARLETVDVGGKRLELIQKVLEQFDVILPLSDGRWIVPLLSPGQGFPTAPTPPPAGGHALRLRACMKSRPPGLFHRLGAMLWKNLDVTSSGEAVFFASYIEFEVRGGVTVTIDVADDVAQSQRLLEVTVRSGTTEGANKAKEVMTKAANELRDLMEFFPGTWCAVRTGNGTDICEWEAGAERVPLDAGDIGRLVWCDTPDEVQRVGAGDIGKRPVMISYKHEPAEEAIAMRILDRLEANEGIGCWIDRAEIVGGDTWRASIAAGIRAARVVLFAKSSNAVHSEYCEEELCYAERLGVPVIPLLVGAPPGAHEYRARMFDLVGAHVQYVDFSHAVDSDDVSRAQAAFDAAYAELVPLVMAKVGDAARLQVAKPRLAGRVEVPDVASVPGGLDGGSDTVYLLHHADDAVAARRVAAWLVATGAAVVADTIQEGERPESTRRSEKLLEAPIVVPVLTRAFTSCRRCWIEMAKWDSFDPRKALVPVLLEGLGSDWAVRELELLLGRHLGDGIDLTSGSPDAGCVSLCRRVAALGAPRPAPSAAAPSAAVPSAAPSAAVPSAAAPAEDVGSWTPDDVCTWLATHNLGAYADRFRAEGVDGDVLLTLDDALLDHLDVEHLVDRRRLIAKAAKLK